jgi:hypothetical protein
LKEIEKGRSDKGEEVSSFSMTSKKRGDNGNWKRTHQFSFCEELTLDEAVNLS